MADAEPQGPSGPLSGDQGPARPNPRKVREGIVVSAAMEKTAVVAVIERVRHRRYTKTSELREMSEDELGSRLAEARQELFNLRFQHVTGQLDNYARLGQLRRDIARIETVLRENEIAAAEAAEAEADAEWQAAAEARRARVAASRRTAPADEEESSDG